MLTPHSTRRNGSACFAVDIVFIVSCKRWHEITLAVLYAVLCIIVRLPTLFSVVSIIALSKELVQFISILINIII